MQAKIPPSQISWKIPIFIGIASFLVRWFFIHHWPNAFQFDAYQRWAGRDHLFIQVWLPGAQIWVWLVGKFGGTMLQTRYVFAILSSISLALGSRLAQYVSSERAGLLYFPAILFGPYIVWGTVPYQESTLLIFLFSSMLLFQSYPRISDFLMGAASLVRYEAWPLLWVHLYLRRKREALICLWGILALMLLGILGWNEPFMPSPDSFDDWNGLNDVSVKKTRRLFKNFVIVLYNAGGFYFIGLGLLVFYKHKLKKEEWMLFFIFVGQLSAVIGWILSLGITFSRMLILLCIPIFVLAAAVLDRNWSKIGDGKIIIVSGFVILSYWSLFDAYRDNVLYKESIKWEVNLLKNMRKCAFDTWEITPRPHPGPRNRHDGCEVIQGLSSMRAGQDFDCTTWSWDHPTATMSATWNNKDQQYDIERIGEKKQYKRPTRTKTRLQPDVIKISTSLKQQCPW